MKASGNYVLINGTQAGPFTLDQLKSMWQTGQLTSETPSWFEGLSEWIPLGVSVEDAIAVDKRMELQTAQVRESQALVSSVKPGWGNGYYAFLVLITMLVPIGGFVIGLAGVFDPAKRKQAGQLMAFSILWTIIVGGLLMSAYR